MRRVEVSNKAPKVDGIHSVDAIDLLLLQFLSAPEDGREKRPKHVAQYCSYK